MTDGPDAPDATRILVLVDALHSRSGGGVTYLANVLPLFAEDAGLDLHLCIHEDQRASLPDGIAAVTVHALDFRHGFWRVQLAEQCAVPRLARRIGADVVFCPANFAPLLCANAVIVLRNAPGVALVEKRPAKIAYWALVTLGTAASLMRCRRAIAVSDYARGVFARLVPRRFRARITVVPHGVAARFSPGGGTEDREDFLLTVSDIYVQKNLEALLLAVARLRERRPEVTLRIAGRAVDAAYFERLQRIVRAHALDDAVSFLGHVAPDDLVTLYRRCAVFVFPSAVETFGNPLVEAMACGAPVASSKAAAMPEVLGDAAEYFDWREPAEIAAVLDRMLGDAALRRRLGENGVRRAQAFSWTETARRTLAVVREAATA